MKLLNLYKISFLFLISALLIKGIAVQVNYVGDILIVDILLLSGLLILSYSVYKELRGLKESDSNTGIKRIS